MIDWNWGSIFKFPQAETGGSDKFLESGQWKLVVKGRYGQRVIGITSKNHGYYFTAGQQLHTKAVADHI